ncbi:MAG: patatin-like phospholipase family protein [Pseudomonadota bacterium]
MRCLLCIIAIWLLNGCALAFPDKIHYSLLDRQDVFADEAQTNAVAPIVSEGETIIGIALSGGGSRASVFGAASLEVLAEAGILQQATYISSVSGGGFPAAYYAIHKPQPCADASRPGERPCTSEDYATFKKTMRHNFLNDMTLRQIVRPSRVTSPTRRLISLQDALENKITKDATFADLPAAPILLINGARYDDGRRFVFSNLAIPEEEGSDLARFSHPALRTASFSLPGCSRAVPGDFSVALAIGISAGFPPLLGPASIALPADCDGGPPRYWHLGDGGILENTGVETIEDFATRAMKMRDPKAAAGGRVLIFSIDAGRSTPADQMMQTRSLNLWRTDPGRVVEIAGMRARGYRAVTLQQTRDESPVKIDVITMKYTDAQLTSWPASCGRKTPDPAAIKAKLVAVPTNLKITKCDADLMEHAARDVVTRNLVAHGFL